MRSSSPRLAVLVDGDNIGADAMDPLFAAIGELGNPIIRIVYRGQGESKKWEQAASRHLLAFDRRHPYL